MNTSAFWRGNGTNLTSPSQKGQITLGKALRDQNYNVFGHVGKQIRQIQYEIMRIWSHPNLDINKLRSLESQLDATLDKDEIMWKKRSRI